MAASILDQVTIVGNAGNLDREHSWLPANGDKQARFSFGVAVTPRVMNQSTNQWEDGETTWHNVTAYGTLAENLHASINKGDQVIIIGHNTTRTGKDSNTGEERTFTNVVADYAGASLRWATVAITRNTSNSGSATRRSAAPAARAAAPTAAPAPAPVDNGGLDTTSDDDFDALFN